LRTAPDQTAVVRRSFLGGAGGVPMPHPKNPDPPESATGHKTTRQAENRQVGNRTFRGRSPSVFSLEQKGSLGGRDNSCGLRASLFAALSFLSGCRASCDSRAGCAVSAVCLSFRSSACGLVTVSFDPARFRWPILKRRVERSPATGFRSTRRVLLWER